MTLMTDNTIEDDIDNSHNTPLHVAAKQGHIICLQVPLFQIPSLLNISLKPSMLLYIPSTISDTEKARNGFSIICELLKGIEHRVL